MKNHLRKAVSLLLSATMLCAVATGCGSPSANNAAATPAPAAPAAPAASDATPAPAAPAEPAASATPQVFVAQLAGDPFTFQPNTTADDFNFSTMQNVYNRLVKLDYSKQIIPDLARSWETSDDGLQITFHLADNVYWHDGVKFSSADVKYTLDGIRENPDYFASFYMTNIASIDCPDDNTVVLNMSKPDVAVIGYLGWLATFILPKHIFDNGQSWDDNPASQAPIGTGPFKFVKYTPSVSIELEKNPNYWDGEVKLDKLIFQIIPETTTAVQALRTGEIDYMEAIPNTDYASLNAEGYRLTLGVYPSPMYFLFNYRPGHETPEAVRKAIALCFNREDITNKVFSNVRAPEYNFYPSIVEWASNSNAKAPAYNIAEAVKVLEDAGYTKDADGYYVRGITVECYTVDNAPDVVRLISAACKEAGIELLINAQEYQAWAQTVDPVTGPGDFDIVLTGGFQGPDPAALANRVGTGGASNMGMYSNSEIDGLFAEALMNSDESYRQQRYYRIQEILSQELPIIPIVSYASYEAAAPNVRMLPSDCEGVTGWAEFSRTYFE